MQKKITLGSTLVLAIAVLLLTSASLQQKEKTDKGNSQKNEQKANNGNDKAQKGNNNKDQNNGRGNNNQDRNEKQKENPQNNGNNGNNGNGNNGNGNNKQKDDKDYKDKDNNGQGNDKNKNDDKLKFDKDVLYGYNWNDDDFKNRNRYKKQDKVTVCHKINGNGEPGVAINVSENAVKAHMNHGDVMGECPAVSNTTFSNGFLKNRQEYFNNLQQTQEEVYYSRSVLDYAMQRLSNGRLQLQQLQNNNAPAQEIQRKQQAVVALEQNTTLLQSLIGVAVEVVANKLL